MSLWLMTWSIASSGLTTQLVNNYLPVVLNGTSVRDSYDYWTMPLGW